MSESNLAEKLDTWRGPILTEVVDPQVSLTKTDSGVRVSVSGRYPRPGHAEQAFVGGSEATVAPSGAVSISYAYTPTNATGTLPEAGLTVAVPTGQTEFRWIGQGPFAGYPGKDRLNEFGLFHPTREDLRFQGNRRETEFAALTTPGGAGGASASRRTTSPSASSASSSWR